MVTNRLSNFLCLYHH